MNFDDRGNENEIIEVCSNCFSPRIAPYMGYETGKRFICQDCDSISMVTIEFENIESLVKFLKEKRKGENQEFKN
jgi:hypothetical protein